MKHIDWNNVFLYFFRNKGSVEGYRSFALCGMVIEASGFVKEATSRQESMPEHCA